MSAPLQRWPPHDSPTSPTCSGPPAAGRGWNRSYCKGKRRKEEEEGGGGGGGGGGEEEEGRKDSYHLASILPLNKGNSIHWEAAQLFGTNT